LNIPYFETYHESQPLWAVSRPGTVQEKIRSGRCAMKKILIPLILTTVFCFFVTPGSAGEAGKEKTGKDLFQQHCAVCHPNGDNIVNPAFSLHKKDMAAHSVKTPVDIIGKMRNPGPGMTKFDKATIPDNDAKKIAAYILNAFK
jgi:cytochrome c6